MDEKMKKYIRRVRRRLELPEDLKERVMSDFGSAVQARRDAGNTDSQIIDELGAPKDAAAVLNEQMKEYTFRKSPWRFLFAAVAIYGATRLLGNLIVRVYTLFVGASIAVSDSATVGIIGGADGPTAIFVTAPRWIEPTVSVVALATGIVGFVLLRRCRRR